MPDQMQDEESTRVVVMKMAKSRRKGAAIIAVAIVIALALAGIWAATSAKSCLAEKKDLEKSFEPQIVGGSPPGVMDPHDPKATVYIFLSTEGQITFDGVLEGKGITRLKMKATPGKHIIRAELKKNTFEQSMVARAGEGFLVDFDDEGREVSIKRLYNIK